MNRTSRYDRIRKLIADWYDGTTSVSNEMEIRQFFRDADLNGLPDDIRREATVFRTVDMLSAENPDKSLLAEIEAEAGRERHSRRLKLRRRLLVAATTVAASLALFFIQGLRPDNNATIPAGATILASAEAVPSQPDDSIATAPKPETDTDAECAQAPVSKPKTISPRPSRRNEAIAMTADEDGYICIDNPEEAACILAKVQKRYSRAVAMTTKAFSETENVFNSTENIIRTSIEKRS